MKKASTQHQKPMTEAQLRDYWDTHEVTDELLATPQAPEADFDLPKKKTRSRSISLRLDSATERRLKVLAGELEKPYQTLLKEFVLERLYEEEKRIGLV